MHARTLLLSLLFLGMAVAGCASKPSRILTTEEAPLGPQSLKVGENRLGQYLRSSFNSSFWFDTISEGGEREVRHFEDRTVTERWIRRESTHDAFLRPVDVIVYKYRYTDLDPPEQEWYSLPPVRTESQALDVKNRRIIYVDGTWFDLVHDFSCFIVCQGGAQPERIDFERRLYPRASESPEWASLAGQILTLQKTLSFNRTIRETIDGVEHVYVHYRNYTAIKEAEFRGDRVFSIVSRSETVQVKPPPEPEEDSPRPAPAPEAGSRPKAPKPIFYTYVSSKSPIPVKEVFHFPVWSESERRYRWNNFSSEVEVVEPGTEVVRFGDEPLGDYGGSAVSVPLRDYAKQATSTALSYPLSAAWSYLSTSPLQTGFRSYLEENPKAYLATAVYTPDATHQTYKWQLQMMVPDKAQADIFEAQKTFLVNQRAVGVEEGGEASTRMGGPRGLKEKVLETKLSSLEDGYQLYRKLRSGPEPAASVAFVRPFEHDYFGGGSEDRAFMATLTFGRLDARPGIIPFESTRWRANDTVSINLMDGGLHGFNATALQGQYRWPSIYRPLMAGAPPELRPFLLEAVLPAYEEAVRPLLPEQNH